MINNISDLRDHAVLTLEKLSKKYIDVTEAGVTAKLCETIVSTIKAQLEYHRMLEVKTHISFLDSDNEQEHKIIEGKILNKKILSKK